MFRSSLSRLTSVLLLAGSLTTCGLATLASPAAAVTPIIVTSNQPIAIRPPVIIGLPPVRLTACALRPPSTRSSACTIGAGLELTNSSIANYTGTTPASSGSPSCPATANAAWYTFTGTGHRIRLTTGLSNYDTVLAVYRSGAAIPDACDDDGGDSSGGNTHTSDLSFTSVTGQAYQVEVGHFGSAACPGTPSVCTLVLGRNPDNDDRADAVPLSPSATISTVSNKYAGVETSPAEPVACALSGGGSATATHTEWYKLTLAGAGSIDIFATGMNSVLNLFPDGGSTTSLGCDAGAAAEVTPHLAPGTYDLQVSSNGSGSGAVTLHSVFTPDNDQDRDGFIARRDGGNDCNDHNGAIHPGARDVPNDHVDQNCDGHDAIDADHDGADAPPDGADCNDHSAAMRPGATDVPGDRIDQNCDGRDAPFPVLGSDAEIHYLFFAHFTKLTVFDILGPKQGSTVRLTCKGKGCPLRSKSVQIRQTTAKLALARLVKKGKFAQKAKLTVRITSPGQIGDVLTYTFRNGKAPQKKTQCLMPGAKQPQKHC